MSQGAKWILGVVVALIIVALIQGAAVKKVGVGAFSVEFDRQEAPGASQTGGGQEDPGTTTRGGSGSSGDSPSGSTRSSRGKWSADRGILSITVTQVDDQNGHIRLHAKAVNDGDNAITLPLFGSFVATDNAGKTYEAVPVSNEWHATVPAGGASSGIIELEQRRGSGARSLSISFTTIYGGPEAPRGGITVEGIVLP